MATTALNGQFAQCTHEKPRSGDLAVIETQDDELLFKRIYITNGSVLCISLNHDPRYRPITIKRNNIRRMRKVWGVKF